PRAAAESSRATFVLASADPTATPLPPLPPPSAMGASVVPAAEAPTVEAALPDATSPDEEESEQVALPGTSHPAPNNAAPSYVLLNVPPGDTPDECIVAEVCIDQYLWALYQRTPKLDTIKVSEKVKVTVKRKGKTRTVMKTVTKLVDEDFTWKDPKAAQRINM